LGGELVDIAFPQVPPEAGPEQVRAIGSALVSKIVRLHPDVVLVQGEFTLSFFLVSSLQELGFTCVAATTKRRTEIERLPDGSSRRVSVFQFVQFRRYCEDPPTTPT